MYENYQMRESLERQLENLKINPLDSKEDAIQKNINFGVVKYLLKKVYDKFFVESFIARISFSSKIWGINFHATDAIYTAGFMDGYRKKKSEEFVELILTEPYNRISEN